MRKLIISLSGIAILMLGMFGFKTISSGKEDPEKKTEKTVKLVYVDEVKNEAVPISITTSGSITARDRMTLFSEVQGIFLPTNRRFKAGEKYSRGESLIRIDSEEFRANVIAQRSAFKSLITGILPDIQFDYPNALEKWQSYLKSIDIESALPPLPKVDSEKESSYLTGKNIYVTFYNIKNLEARLKKYKISAPYTGVLVEANINPGALVSPGQKLGEFIKPYVFELALNVNANLQNFLKIGKEVALSNIEHTQKYTGTVSRINEQIDRATQTIEIFVEVTAKDLKEGEYLEAMIDAKPAENMMEIPRTLLVNNQFIYTVTDSVLHVTPVHIFYASLDKVVIDGLADGTQYVTKPISGGYEGMKIKVVKD